MLIPSTRVMQGLNAEFARLQNVFADSNVDGSAALSITVTLQVLLNRELAGAAGKRQQLDRFDALLTTIADLAHAAPKVSEPLAALRRSVAEVKAVQGLTEIESGWRDLIARLQALMTQLVAEPALDGATKKAIAQALVAWESAELLGHSAVEAGSSVDETEISNEKLTAYLRDRFAEPELKMTTFQPLAGGFGKQTILFAVEGKALSGEFVMRRDMGGVPILENDCHQVRHEYPTIKAMHQRGFPAPDALWLDTEHGLLPGGDFFVMRRAPGKMPGNFFGARTAVPPGLTNALGDVMAQLHLTPPLTELGDLTESICSDWWKLSKRECTARYIRGWYDMYLRCTAVPSPSVIAIYGWLLDNLPDRKGPPTLVHGDIGFHNMLFDNDQLSVLLDWEFAHVGDPAEDIGMVKVTTGASINWDQLMQRYVAAGGEPVDAKTLHFFRVWGFARNAAAAQLATSLFAKGHADELKLHFLPYAHFPQFIRGAQALIDEA